MKKLLVFSRCLFLFISTVLYAQPQFNLNIAATYDTLTRGYLEIPNFTGEPVDGGCIWHLIHDTDNDGLDLPVLEGDNIGLPSGDDSLIYVGYVGDGQGLIDSISTIAEIVTLDPSAIGGNLQMRIFGSDSLAPEIPYMESIFTNERGSEFFLDPLVFTVTPSGYGGVMNKWLGVDGIPAEHVIEQYNPGSLSDFIILGERAKIRFIGDEGHGTRYADFCSYECEHPRWNMDLPSLNFCIVLSVDFNPDDINTGYLHQLIIHFDINELQQIYGDNYSTDDMRIWKYTSDGWIENETNLTSTDEINWSAELQSTEPPLSGWFTLAPFGLSEVENGAGIVREYRLHPPYPNPFNSTATIRLDLKEGRFTRLNVYNILGQEVASLHSGLLKAGRHKFIFNGGNLSSGIYFVQVESGTYISLQKVLLIR